MRKILIYSLFILLGGFAGYGLVILVKSKANIPDIGGIVLLSAVLCLALWAANIVAEGKKSKILAEPEKPEKPGEQKPSDEKGEEESSETPVGVAKKIGIKSQTGWLIPKSDEPKTGFPISKDSVYVGRNPSSDILLNDDSVSRKHANITHTDGIYTIFDLNSKNGSFVNGQRIQKHILQDGDIITMGNLSFIFKAPAEGMEIISEVAVGAAPEGMELIPESGEVEEDSPTRTGRAPAIGMSPTGTKKSPHMDPCPTGTKKAPPVPESPTGTRKYPDDSPKT